MSGEIDRGEWVAFTIGTALGFLMDQGDPVAIWREAHRTEADEDGQYIARYEVVLVPNGMVQKTIEAYCVKHVHKTLKALAGAGLIT